MRDNEKVIVELNEALRVVHAAIEAGITFMDNAWEYHEGRAEVLMGKAIADRRDRVFLMTKVCTHGRGKRVSMTNTSRGWRSGKLPRQFDSVLHEREARCWMN